MWDEEKEVQEDEEERSSLDHLEGSLFDGMDTASNEEEG